MCSKPGLKSYTKLLKMEPKVWGMLDKCSATVLLPGSITVFMPRIMFEPRLMYSRLTLNLLCGGELLIFSFYSYWDARRALLPLV